MSCVSAALSVTNLSFSMARDLSSSACLPDLYLPCTATCECKAVWTCCLTMITDHADLLICDQDKVGIVKCFMPCRRHLWNEYSSAVMVPGVNGTESTLLVCH